MLETTYISTSQLLNKILLSNSVYLYLQIERDKLSTVWNDLRIICTVNYHWYKKGRELRVYLSVQCLSRCTRIWMPPLPRTPQSTSWQYLPVTPPQYSRDGSRRITCSRSKASLGYMRTYVNWSPQKQATSTLNILQSCLIITSMTVARM